MAVQVLPAADLADPVEAHEGCGSEVSGVDRRHEIGAARDGHGGGHGGERRHRLVERGRQRHRVRRVRCVRGQASCPFPGVPAVPLRRTVRAHSPDVATLAHLPGPSARGSTKRRSVPGQRSRRSRRAGRSGRAGRAGRSRRSRRAHPVSSATDGTGTAVWRVEDGVRPVRRDAPAGYSGARHGVRGDRRTAPPSQGPAARAPSLHRGSHVWGRPVDRASEDSGAFLPGEGAAGRAVADTEGVEPGVVDGHPPGEVPVVAVGRCGQS